MASKRKAAAILRKAAKLIETRFTKGALCEGKGDNEKYCALGSLNKVANGTPYNAGYFDASGEYRVNMDRILARQALAYMIRHVNFYGSVPSYNDAPNTTGKDVAKLMRKAARALEHGLQVGA